MVKLTERQWRMLREMAALTGDDRAWLVTGHNRIACRKLQKLGLAEFVGTDGAIGEAFTITPAGRKALEGE